MSPLAVKIVIKIVVLVSSAQGIWVCNRYTCTYCKFYHYTFITDDSRKCADEAGTPPANQTKIVNMERYVVVWTVVDDEYN